MMHRYIVLAGFVLLLLFGCPQTEVPANETPAVDYPVMTPVGPAVNQTEPGPEPEISLSDYSVDVGDTVWVNYTLWVNGTIYDTNNEVLAKEAGIHNPARKYEPFKFDVEFNKGVIPGFVINVIGMKVNETVVFNVDPDRGYGPYDPSKVFVISRYYNKSNFEVIPRSYLEDAGENISNGTAYQTAFGDVFIHDFNDENVTLFYVLLPGHSFVLNGIPQQVASYDSTNFTATIEFMLEEGQSYKLPHPQTGAPTLYRVTGKTDQNITLDGNHPLANETLTFEVTLLDVEPSQG